MAQKKIVTKPKSSHKIHNHMHLWDIQKKYFPRTTKAKEYLRDLLRTTEFLEYTNKKVQYSSQICAFNIRSILNRKPRFSPETEDVFKEIKEFVYHYENYCFRLYMYREKLLQFINSFLPIGYEDKEVRIRHILINPVVKQAGLLNIFLRLKSNVSFSNVIADREKLTHRLLYGKEIDYYFRPLSIKTNVEGEDSFKEWTKQWGKEISSRALKTNKCALIVDYCNNTMAEKLIKYKEKINKKHI